MKIVKEFPKTNWSMSSLNNLLKKIDRTVTDLLALLILKHVIKTYKCDISVS